MKTLWRPLFLLVLFLFVTDIISAQDIKYARAMIDSLASPPFQGRGYVNKGDSLAADFLIRQLKDMEVSGYNSIYKTPYSFSINTFPGAMHLSIDGKALVPGSDYTIASSSPSIKGKYKLLYLTADVWKNDAARAKFLRKPLQNKVVVADTGLPREAYEKLVSAQALIAITDSRPIFDVSQGRDLLPFAAFYVSREKLTPKSKKAEIEVESQFINEYATQNIIAWIPGTKNPESYIVFTAHYDHLGKMGADVYFPGANDNASGCAMLLDLAKFYSKAENAPDCSIVFMFFSGEEAGLMGSGWLSEYPPFELDKIKFMINLDMVSTGSDGIKVVNGSVLTDEFNLLSEINKKQDLLKAVSPRGEAANSDHYFFYKKGVKSFFIYTLGKEWTEYHTPDDKSEGLPLTSYEKLFKLVTLFADALMKGDAAD